MSFSRINTEILIESLSYSLSIIEPGLRFVDSNISIIHKANIDILAVDAGNRLTIITANAKHATNQILSKAVISWEWVNDFRADFTSGILSAAGIAIENVPPKLLILAPSFSKSMVQMANYCHQRINIDLLAISWKGIFVEGLNVFQFDSDALTKLNLLEYGLASSSSINNFNGAQNYLINQFRHEFAERNKSGLRAYQPYSF